MKLASLHTFYGESVSQVQGVFGLPFLLFTSSLLLNCTLILQITDSVDNYLLELLYPGSQVSDEGVVLCLPQSLLDQLGLQTGDQFLLLTQLLLLGTHLL